MGEKIKELLSVAAVIVVLVLLVLLFDSCESEQKKEYMECPECYESYTFTVQDGGYSLSSATCGYCKARNVVNSVEGVITLEDLSNAIAILEDAELEHTDAYYAFLDYLDEVTLDGEEFQDLMNAIPN